MTASCPTACAQRTDLRRGKTMTEQEMKARILELETLVANKKAKGTSLKVSAKGAVSLYGVGRFPVTLYASQWRAVIAAIPTIQAFLTENASVLSEKAEVPAVTTPAV